MAAYAYPGAAAPGSSEGATGAAGAAGVVGAGQPTPQQVAQEAIAKTLASLTPEQVAGGVVPVADNRRGYLFGTLIGQVCGSLCVGSNYLVSCAFVLLPAQSVFCFFLVAVVFVRYIFLDPRFTLLFRSAFVMCFCLYTHI